MEESQKHLSKRDQINLGSFYTPKHLVQITYSIIRKNIPKLESFYLVDTSCGYGSFLENAPPSFRNLIGADIDAEAIKRAKSKINNASFVVANALKDTSRAKLNLTSTDRFIVVGNPPYNDTTSLIRQNIKTSSKSNDIDRDLKARDLGMSFLLSYSKLKADYVCVLHPLSYLIKKSNFATLKPFTLHYTLIDALIVSSHEFSDTSRGMAFPIVIALYKRGQGMSYQFIHNYRFKTKEGPVFQLSSLDSIANYLSKYPNRHKLSNSDHPMAKFYTMRDINALKRSRTFIEKDMSNTVYVIQKQFAYYCYVDVFKRRYIDKLPYFVGNCDLMINDQEFQKIKECFIADSVMNNAVLKKHFKYNPPPDSEVKINNYFRNLLGALS